MNSLHDDHEALRDDLAAFALDALPAEQADRVRDHLEDCESCRSQLQWLRPAVDVLPAAVEQLAPPESLRQNLLAIVAEEAGQSGAVELAGGHVPRREWIWKRFGGVALRPAAGFAAVVLLAAGAAGYALRGGDGETAKQGESTRVAAEALGVPASAVSATLERHGDSATLHVHKLPELPRGSVYQAWVQRAGVMEPASVFVLRDDRTAEAAVPGPLEGASGVFVTQEPEGGSQKPTTPAVLKAPLQ